MRRLGGTGGRPGWAPGVIDPEQLGSLMARYAAALELYARQWCGTPEDVVQEAFVRLAGLRSAPEAPGAWLFTAVRHGAINAGVAGQRRRRHEARVASRTAIWFAPDPDAGLDPGAAQEALAGLPLEQREVIVAHLWGGLTFEQIGALAGTSASSAHRQYHNGLAGLRARLGVAAPCRPRTS